MENENNNKLKVSMNQLQISGRTGQKTANKCNRTVLNGFCNFQKGELILENLPRGDNF